MIYQHPLAYLVGIEGLALLRAWAGGHDEEFVRARLAEVRMLLDDETLAAHAGVVVQDGVTGAAYQQWADTYDDPGNELLELDLMVVDEILDALPIGVAVDAACGTGRLSARLADRGHVVVGVDDSPEMLAHAVRRVPGARFVTGDLRALPVPDASADLVTSALALTHVSDLHAVLAEFARVLRPGGSAVVSDVHPELVYRGSVVKAEGADGQPQVADVFRHTVGDYVRAALGAGFIVRRLEEPRHEADTEPEGPVADPVRETGPWRTWPWSLLDLVPDAAAAAWDNPDLIVLHLERPAVGRAT